MRSRTMNMSSGKPLQLLTLFAIPLLIGNLFQQAYNLVDSIIVGQFIGAGALAAVGSTGSISFLFFSLTNKYKVYLNANIFYANEFYLNRIPSM